MDLAKIIGNIAPFLSSMLSGPLGTVAGKVIGRLLLNDENASPEAISEALIHATPEQLIQLKQIDNDYKIKLAQIGIDEKQIAAGDMASARNRGSVIQDHVPGILAFLVTIGFFSVLLLVMFYPIQSGISSVIEILLGALGTAWIACISYYFGSSYEAHHALNKLDQQDRKDK